MNIQKYLKLKLINKLLGSNHLYLERNNISLFFINTCDFWDALHVHEYTTVGTATAEDEATAGRSLQHRFYYLQTQHQFTIRQQKVDGSIGELSTSRETLQEYITSSQD